MCYCSSWIIFTFLSFDHILTCKQIPLIGLSTSDNQNNRSSSLVIDYTIRHLKTLSYLNTELVIQHNEQDIPCDMAIGTKMLFDMIDRRPRPLAIFSGSCQIVASAIAETAGIFDLIIVRSTKKLERIFVRKKFDLDHLFGNKFTIYG